MKKFLLIYTFLFLCLFSLGFEIKEANAATSITQTVNECLIEYYYADSDGTKITTANLQRGNSYQLFLRYKDDGLGSKCTNVKHFKLGYVYTRNSVQRGMVQLCQDRGDMTIEGPYRIMAMDFTPGTETQTKNFVHVDSNTYCAGATDDFPITGTPNLAYINATITNAPNNANTNTPPPINTSINANYNGFGQSLGTLRNPLSAKTLPELISRIIRILLGLIAMAAIIMIIIGGFRMVINGSNPGELAKAKAMVIWAIIGLVVALLSFSIVAILQGIITR